jgi:glutamine cyclotransferase
MGKKDRQRRKQAVALPVTGTTGPANTKSPPLAAERPWLIPLIAGVLVIAGIGGFLLLREKEPPVLTYRVVASFPHQSEAAYTQGLEYHRGFLFESTGREKESDWRIVNRKTGEVCYRQGISSKAFGEGITVLGDTLYQITWQDRKCFVYDLAPLKLEELDPATITKQSFEGRRAKTLDKEFTYTGEGWGLTNDGTHIIMSNGAPDGMIRYRNPEDFSVVRELKVTWPNGKAVNKLNELEYVNGFIYANVFMTNDIVKIDAESGAVVARVDMTGILPADVQLKDSGEVLNGIARNQKTGTFDVTGKNWPNLFEVEFIEKE